MFKKVEGHSVLIRATAVSAEQMKLVNDIIGWNKGEPKIRRKDLKLAHGELRGKKASPYFIAKNAACQVKGEHGLYNLAVLKARVEKPVKAVEAADAPKVKSTPKAPKVKKESKGKKEIAPAPETALELAPA